MNQDNHSEADTLIAKYLAGETSPAEEQQLHEWIAENKANEVQFGKAKQLFALNKMHYQPNAYQQLDIDVNLEWQRFKNRAEKSERDKKPLVFNLPLSNQWLRVAASIVLVVVSGFVANYLLTRSGNTIYQTAEKTEAFTLPDGSEVTLNRNSKLTYAKDFGKTTREVLFEGEGFFVVTPDMTKPFEIQADKALVSVLGTSFSVQSYAHRPALEVTVQTGKVQVATMSTSQQVILRAGERAVYVRNSKSLNKEINNDRNFLSWKTKKLIFDAASLEEVAQTLEIAYGVEITVSASNTEACKVTVSFDNQSLDTVLNVLKSTLDLTYSKTANKIEIVEAGC